MAKQEKSIDLRKEKTDEFSDTVNPVPADAMHSALAVQNALIDETRVPKKLPALKQGEKQICVIIYLKLINGDDDFVETLTLNMVSQINAVICNTNKHTKTPGGYTVNKVKLNTEIICR